MIVIAESKRWDVDLADQLKKNLLERQLNQEIVSIYQKEDLNLENLERLSPDFIFFPHWSHMIPEAVFSRFTCIVFHMTDLPFGRGGSPLQNLISRGIYETKISALRCEAGIDTGPVYLKKSLSLYGTAQEIYIRASQIIREMMLELIQEKIQPKPQQGEPVVFKRRTPAQSEIDSKKLDSLEKLFDQIRMLDAEGYPKAFIELGDFKFEFSRASFCGEQIISDVKIMKKNRESSHD